MKSTTSCASIAEARHGYGHQRPQDREPRIVRDLLAGDANSHSRLRPARRAVAEWYLEFAISVGYASCVRQCFSRAKAQGKAPRSNRQRWRSHRPAPGQRAALPQDGEIEREGRERREAAENARRHEQANLIGGFRRRARSSMKMPMARQPAMLTASVAQGKPGPSSLSAATLTRCRSEAPIAPPAATRARWSIVVPGTVYFLFRRRARHLRVRRWRKKVNCPSTYPASSVENHRSG